MELRSSCGMWYEATKSVMCIGSCPSGCSGCYYDRDAQVVCSACFDGYYLSGSSCEPCPLQCSKCKSYSECLSCSYANADASNQCRCNSTYHLTYFTRKCVLQSEISDPCPIPGLFLFQQPNKGSYCESCLEGCLECSDKATCSKCDRQNGYILNAQACVSCFTEFASNEELCLQNQVACSNQSCQLCAEQCRRCAFEDGNEFKPTCSQCEDGYFLDGENACVPCQSQCKDCQYWGYKCSSCKGDNRSNIPDCDCNTNYIGSSGGQCTKLILSEQSFTKPSCPAGEALVYADS